MMYQGFVDDRLAFEVERDPKRRRWRMWRVSIKAWETGWFKSVDEAKAWGSKLNPKVRRQGVR